MGSKNNNTEELRELKEDVSKIVAARGYRTIGYDKAKKALIIEKMGRRFRFSLVPFLKSVGGN